MNGSYTSLANAYSQQGQIKKKSIEKFESGEHVSMADGLVVTDSTCQKRQYVPPVFIPLPGPTGTGNYSNNFKINMDTGDTYTFGQLLALAGDFYWGRKQVSDFRGDDTAAMTQFLLNFNTLNNPFNGGDPDLQIFINQTDNTASDQARQIIEIINQEIDQARTAIENNKPVRGIFYTKVHEQSDLDFMNITRQPGTTPYSSVTSGAAASQVSNIGGGRYLQLALKNNDHFANDALYAYTIGHTAALIEAEKGFQTNFLDMEFYHRALAMDAMSCHFLSDTFAGGHSRTNARDIRNGPGAYLDWSPAIAGLLVKTQHDEENTRGLNVRNAKGDQWITYGDKNLFRPENAASRTMQNNAIQSSIDEIWLAFHTGVITLPSDYKAVRLMPLPGNPGSTLTPTGGYTGDIVYLDKIPGNGTSVCDAPNDCSELGPPELWGNRGTSACSTSGNKRMCQRVSDLNDYAPFWSVSDNKLWRRQGRDRDIPKGKQMTRATSAISAERAYANGADLQPSPILPPTSQDSVAYNIQSYPLAPAALLSNAKTSQNPLKSQATYFK